MSFVDALKSRIGVQVLCVAVCGVALCLFFLISVATIINPHGLEMSEGEIFAPAMNLAAGKQIYGGQVIFEPPYHYAAYGPWYYVLTGSLLKFAGLAYWPGRLLSFVATIGTAALIFRFIWNRYALLLPSIIAATIFIMLPPVWSYGNIQRVDALGVFFSVLALYLASTPAARRWRFFLAGGAIALAFLTKATLVAAAAAIIVCLVLAGRLKQLLLVSFGAILVLSSAEGLLLLTANHDYWINALYLGQLPYSARSALIVLRGMAQSQTLVATVMVIVLWLAIDKPPFRLSNNIEQFLPLFYLVISAFIGLVTSGNSGGTANYYYEFCAALAICGGLGLASLMKSDYHGARIAATLVVAALFFELLLFRSSSIQGKVLMPRIKNPVYERILQDLNTLVPPGEPVAGGYPHLVLEAGRQPYFNDISMYQIGPSEFTSVLNDCLVERRLAAVLSVTEHPISGYKLVRRNHYKSLVLSGSENFPGPLLYLREDLWDRWAASLNAPAMTNQRDSRPVSQY